MFFGRRKTLLRNIEALNKISSDVASRIVDWMNVDASLIRYALRNGGDPDLAVPTEDLRMLIVEQIAATLMLQENLMALQGRKPLIEIGRMPVPLHLDDSEECIARVWARTWPDQRYPRWHKLTADQQYYCFGPEGKKRFGPEPEDTAIRS
jgi:hypothetical protein